VTLEEIAEALGVQTVEQIAEECGFAPGDLGVVEAAVAAEMVRPTLVLDFRGGSEEGNRWAKLAKGPLPPAAMPARLDPRTGLAFGKRRVRR